MPKEKETKPRSRLMGLGMPPMILPHVTAKKAKDYVDNRTVRRNDGKLYKKDKSGKYVEVDSKGNFKSPKGPHD